MFCTSGHEPVVKVSIDVYTDELVPELLQFDKTFHSYTTPKINPFIVLEFDGGLYVVHAPVPDGRTLRV